MTTSHLAASFFAECKLDTMRPTVGNWDAVFYSGAHPPCQRRVDILHAVLDETFACFRRVTGNKETFDASPMTRTALKD